MKLLPQATQYSGLTGFLIETILKEVNYDIVGVKPGTIFFKLGRILWNHILLGLGHIQHSD
jgi:hypothetical protein